MKRLGWCGAVIAGVLLLGCGAGRSGSENGTGSNQSPIYTPITRTYYIAADELKWDYAPSGIDKITGLPFDAAANVYMQQGDMRIGKVYRKAVFREYTDSKFSTLKPVLSKWKHLGTMGPLIRAVVGDTIVVVFKNNTRNVTSMHPHGLLYAKDSEGADYVDGTSGVDKSDEVPPGQSHVYTWKVPDSAGPGPNDGTSVAWSYDSHVDVAGDTNAGLFGPIVVTSLQAAREDGTPNDVDHEVVVTFGVMDENRSWLLDENITNFADNAAQVNKADPGFIESNRMRSMNGFSYGNLPTVELKAGERVRWYLMSLGTDVGLHTPTFHGQTVMVEGRRTDAVELLPGAMKVADMQPDNLGTWLLESTVDGENEAGMVNTYVVKQ